MKDYIGINKVAYDLTAPEYLKRVGKSTAPLSLLAGKPFSYAKQQFGTTLRILEIGPGSGEISAYFAEQGCDTTALDVSAEIHRNVKKIAPTTAQIEADIYEYDLAPNYYHLVYCGALIHLFTSQDARTILTKIASSLLRGGILFMNTTIHPNSAEGFLTKKDYDIPVKRYRHQYTEFEFKSLLRESGFEIIEMLSTDEEQCEKYWLAGICRRI